MKPIILLALLCVPLAANAICVDNPNSNVYVGNQGSYSETGTYHFLMESGCGGPNRLFFPYCENGEVIESFFSCNCLNGRCIAENADVFYMVENLGKANQNLREGIISTNLIESAVDSWITT